MHVSRTHARMHDHAGDGLAERDILRDGSAGVPTEMLAVVNCACCTNRIVWNGAEGLQKGSGARTGRLEQLERRLLPGIRTQPGRPPFHHAGWLSAAVIDFAGRLGLP